jgi:predicted phosphodiesterase
MSKTPNIKDAIATAAIPSSKQTPDFGPVQFSFGALSDTHINYQSYNRGAYEKLRNSLDFFARKKMDIVVIAGDITGDRGESPDLEAQYQKHVEIVNASNFSSSKVFEAIGNHGNTPSDSRLLNAYLGSSEEKHPFKGSPYYHVLVDGNAGENDNLFIFMAHEIEASSDVATKDNFSAGQINWLENLLSRYDNGNTNIFVVLHSPFLNYGAGDIENGSYKNCIKFDGEFTQTMRLFSLLEEHKDAIVMSGHTHVSFYENANYSDENNQFARTVHIGSNCQPCAYGNQSTLVRNFDGRHNVTADYGSEGYTVEVYSDFIVYSGYNLSTGKKIPAACLLIPVKAYGEPEDNDFILENSGDEINDDNPNADDKPTNFPTPDTEGSPSATPQNQTEGGVNTPASAYGSLLHIDDEKKSNGIWIWMLVLGIIIVPPIIVVIVLLIVRKK